MDIACFPWPARHAVAGRAEWRRLLTLNSSRLRALVAREQHHQPMESWLQFHRGEATAVASCRQAEGQIVWGWAGGGGRRQQLGAAKIASVSWAGIPSTPLQLQSEQRTFAELMAGRRDEQVAGEWLAG